jgi:DNA-binding beta-propeller fold protein YncE
MKIHKLRWISGIITLCLVSSLISVNKVVVNAADDAPPAVETVLIGTGGFQKGVFSQPTYLNVEQQRVYVSDTKNNRIQAFIRGNVFQLMFGGYGQNEREFDGVAGICSTPQMLYVVDSINSRVQIINSQGVFVSQFGSFGNKEGEFTFPTDIVLLGQRLYVLDSGNNRVQIFDLNGKFISSFGRSGKGDGEFNHPLSLAVSEDRIFVSDTMNHRVQLFDLEGNYLSTFGWLGSEEKALNQPKGIMIDDATLYVVDSMNRRIQIFSLAGVHQGQITYDGLKSPYDVATLENRIIVSDQQANRVYVFEKNGRFYGFYGSEEGKNGRFVKPVSVTASNDLIYVLDGVQQNIQSFKGDGSFVSIFPSAEIEKAGFKNMQAIEYYQSKLYVLDSENSFIAVYAADGRFEKKIGKYGSNPGELALPLDLALADNKIFVADSGNSRIQIFDLEGNPILHFGTFGANDGQFIVMSSISARNNALYVADTGNNRVQIFDYEGNFLHKIGKRGLEIGSYYGPKGLFVDPGNKVYVADTLNNRIQVTDMMTQQTQVFGKFGSLSQLPDKEGGVVRGNETFDYNPSKYRSSFLYPQDITVFQHRIIVADTFNRRVLSVPMTAVFGAQIFRLSPSYLDFGSVSSGNPTERNFLVHNQSGNMLSGTITTDNPAVTVDPTTFNAPSQEVKVKISSDKLEQGKDYSAKVLVSVNTGNSTTLTQEISIQFRADSAPDFYTELQPLFVASADEEFVIPVKVIPQNGFNGVVSFVALGLPRNTTPTFDPPSINLSERNTTFLKLNPTSRMIEAGSYEIEIETQAASGGLKRRASSTFVYKQKLDLVPHTVLGELFTATWCINCVHSHTAMNRLYFELGPEKVVWLEYYVQSKEEVRLACDDSEARMKWYQSDQGLPTIYFDGTDYLKGLPVSDDTRTEEGKARVMYEAYRAKVMEKLKQPSVINVGVQNFYDSSTKKGKASATITALDNVPFRDPRIYFVLTENHIEYKSLNGDLWHHFVVRDMLTPANDDKNDYLGTPMKLSGGETFGRKGDVYSLEVDYSILDIYNLSNMSLVVFVQDNVTKTVLQSAEVPVKIINNASYNLIADQSLNQKRTKGEESTITSYLVNTGTRSDTFNINVLNKSQDKWISRLLINGKEDSATDSRRITLRPFETAKIEVKVNIPANAEPKSEQIFTISAFSPRSRTTQAINSRIEVVETRPPNFILSVEALAEQQIMAGESIAYKISLTPDPYFDEEIKLSIKDLPSDIASADFQPSSGRVPFDSVLTLSVKPETQDKDISIELIASGTKLSHSQRLVFGVKRNPDALPPQLEIAYPPENFLTNKKDLEVSGMTDPTASLTINGQTISIEKNGSFVFPMVLEEGQNVIQLKATNRKGLETEIVRLLTLDTLPPSLDIKPIPEEVTQDTILIEGKIEIGSVLTIDTQDVFIDEEGKFSYEHELLRGFNSIEVIAIDQASNTTTIYLEVSLITLIKLRIGSTTAQVNHQDKTLDAPPYIKNGRTMVPIRFISEALGAKVDWDGNLRQITIQKDRFIIRMVIGSIDVFIREEGKMGENQQKLDAPPEITSGRTFVPLRFISETFGAKLDWNAELREITIKS